MRTTIDMDMSVTMAPNAICDGGFKSIAQTTAIVYSSKEIVMRFPSPIKVLGAYIINSCEDFTRQNRIGATSIYSTGDDACWNILGCGSFSDSNSRWMYDSNAAWGYGTTSKNWAMKRVNDLGDHAYSFNEVRFYSCRSLFEI